MGQVYVHVHAVWPEMYLELQVTGYLHEGMKYSMLGRCVMTIGASIC